MKGKSSLTPVAIIVALLVTIIAIPCSSAQQTKETKLPSIAPLATKLEPIVREYYPEAGLTNSGPTIHFECRARDFMIHEPLKTGDWQDARKVRGPNRKGVVCDITLSPGKYENPQEMRMADPSGHRFWTQEKRYYRQLLFIPFSSTYNCHLFVLLRVPPDASPEFIEKFDNLISKYGDYLKPGS